MTWRAMFTWLCGEEAGEEQTGRALHWFLFQLNLICSLLKPLNMMP